MSAAVSRFVPCTKNFSGRLVGVLCGIACVVLLVGAAPAIAQQTAASSAAAAQQAQAAGAQPPNQSAAATIPSYPDSPKGLEKLIKDMLKLQKDGDAKDLAPYVQSLVLPNPAAWFRATFGDEIGATLADSYDRTRINLPLLFPDTLSQLLAKHLTNPEAVSFTDSCNPKASPTEYPVLILRQNSQPLYDIRFLSGTTMTTIAYFAHIDGSFRYLGNFQVKGDWPMASMPKDHASLDSQQVRVPGNITAAKIIHQVLPVYPQSAKEKGIQGTVLFHAVIAEDGSIRGLQLISGQCFLAQSAAEAVSQWRYSPTLLKGEPVRVDTTITVIFNLGG
ncbi:MAG: energy transducer TonB [Candidatus Acidiferrales bacterium]